jgi:hypothetical protein
LPEERDAATRLKVEQYFPLTDAVREHA